MKELAGGMGETLEKILQDPKVRRLEIAEINGAGTLHSFLHECPNLKYSEYGSKDNGVPSEDLLNLSYRDAMFDLVITSETLEHVPDVDLALSEIHRVLKKNGAHVFTVPIVLDQASTRQRAQIFNGKLIHHCPPSYHGGAGTNQSDFLVFYEFGADFVDRCRKTGFRVEVIQDKKNPSLVGLIARKQ
jgi:SAM-dependent methyltransferase